jgi:hypothetical protein
MDLQPGRVEHRLEEPERRLGVAHDQIGLTEE